MNRKLIIGITIAGMLTLVGIWFFVAPSTTKAGYLSLKAGMTKNEIRAILGNPYDSIGGVDRHIGYEGCAMLFFDIDKGTLAWREWEELPYRNRFPRSIFQPIQWPID
jgi:hypothetical protein